MPFCDLWATLWTPETIGKVPTPTIKPRSGGAFRFPGPRREWALDEARARKEWAKISLPMACPKRT